MLKTATTRKRMSCKNLKDGDKEKVLKKTKQKSIKYLITRKDYLEEKKESE